MSISLRRRALNGNKGTRRNFKVKKKGIKTKLRDILVKNSLYLYKSYLKTLGRSDDWFVDLLFSWGKKLLRKECIHVITNKYM